MILGNDMRGSMHRISLATIAVIIAGAALQGKADLAISLTEIDRPGLFPHIGTGLGYVSYTFYLSEEITIEQYAEYWSATHDGQQWGGWYGHEGETINDPAGLSDPVDAMRFCNWLHNGQGSGDTETGAYNIAGASPHPDGWMLNGYSYVERSPDAKWFIPNLNEWVKAFYLNDTSLTQVGTYPYRTSGEWTETVITGYMYGEAWGEDPLSDDPYPYYFSAYYPGGSFTTTNDIKAIYPLTPYISFRVASTTIPEPSSALLLAIGSGGILFYRRAKRRQQEQKVNRRFHW